MHKHEEPLNTPAVPKGSEYYPFIHISQPLHRQALSTTVLYSRAYFLSSIDISHENDIDNLSGAFPLAIHHYI